MKYRKKPIVIEAILWDGEGITKALEFAAESGRGLQLYEDGGLAIETLEGTMRANVGDYIIKGVKNEIYPCKPDIFEETYEKVD